MMMPGVGSSPGGLVTTLDPSPPSFPAAHTTTTPAATNWRWSCTVTLPGLKAPPPLGPHELLTTLIGGHTLAGTPVPHGAAWWRRTQYRPESPPKTEITCPTDRPTSLAPGAAPCRWRPSMVVASTPA